MTAHAVIEQEVAADPDRVFDVVHDYHRRLVWDTLLRRAYTLHDAPPDVGVEAVCTARRRLGGLTFRTRYVAFHRPEVAAVSLVTAPPFFAAWSASVRHRAISPGRSTVIYTLTFRCRPRALAPLLEPVTLAAFRFCTRRRLRALAAYVDNQTVAS